MNVFMAMWVIIVSYLIGSIPFGLIIVKLSTGKDIRSVASGRTGGTNALRAAGAWAGLFTGIFDVLKGAIAVWLARWLVPGNHTWVEVLAPIAAILGHNYSIYLPEKDENGKLRLRGGAGGAPCIGGSLGLWAPSALIIIPIGAAVWYFAGYASLTTLSIALTSIVIFAIRAWYIGAPVAPWQYSLYGVFALIALGWALRPNIRRLIQGNERLVGLRAKIKARKSGQSSTPSSSSQSSSS
jgi:glycerol-3-phosphate acyltransferase PlsY